LAGAICASFTATSQEAGYPAAYETGSYAGLGLADTLSTDVTDGQA